MTPPPAKAGEAERRPTVALLEAYALYCADEALSVVRHDVLNRITAFGALSYELRQALPQQTGENGAVARQRLEDLNRQVGMLTEVVSRKLAQPLDPRAGALVSEALAVVAGLLPVPVAASVAADLRAPLPVSELQVVLLAVLANAVESGATRGAVELRAARSGGASRGEHVVIEVDDRGSGLTEEELERCFERFFTTRPGHAGLGLSAARTLVLRAGGEISLGNRSDGGRVMGARVSISLPMPGQRRGDRT